MRISIRPEHLTSQNLNTIHLEGYISTICGLPIFRIYISGIVILGRFQGTLHDV
tara:strand:+ start:261 stop:422 length:162 start_codon:yes stop_codon:yes gene_type:complete